MAGWLHSDNNANQPSLGLTELGSVQAETVRLHRQSKQGLMDINLKLTEFLRLDKISIVLMEQSLDPRNLEMNKN